MSGPYVKAAILGHPVTHSKSPVIHGYWIMQHRLAGEYNAIDVAPENLGREMHRLIKEEGYGGFNLTIPHKIMALDICDEIDDLAKNVGAVNTVFVRDGKICGTNTDVFGFIENIKTYKPGFDFTAGPAVVLGAGGAAKAVVYGLLQEGAPEIRLVNRSRNRAEALAGVMGDKVRVFDWAQRGKILSDANVLVNTTALGMDGQLPLEIDLEKLPQAALVNDIVYAPLFTDLLSAAMARGNPVVTGIGMLLHQARPAFKAWFGVMPDVGAGLEDLVQG